MERATTKAPTSETPRTSRISAPLMIASRCGSSRSSRAFCSISAEQRALDLASSRRSWRSRASYQSRYERFSAARCRPCCRARGRAYLSAALIVGLPLVERLESAPRRCSPLVDLAEAARARRSSLSQRGSPYSRSFSESSRPSRRVAGSAAAMIARWMEAYSLAEENAASARVRWIISGLLVACAMSWERLEQRVDQLVVAVDRLESEFVRRRRRCCGSSLSCSSWRGDLRRRVADAVQRLVAAASSMLVGGLDERLPGPVGLARAGPMTLKSLAFAPLASGPADWSRSSWSAAASSVACLVISVSSCMLSSCSMSSMDR